MEFDEIVVKESPGLCRCCLSEGCYKDMGTEYAWMNENEVYADMLFECFDISISQLNDGPNGPNRLICEVCITRLRDACYFKKQVLESEKKFVDMVGRGEFKPKAMIVNQSNMKMEKEDDFEVSFEADEAEVEYLEDEMDYIDDEALKTEEPSTSVSDVTAEALPVRSKRGRPRKAPTKPVKKVKAEPKAKSSKALVKDENGPAKGKHASRKRRRNLQILFNYTSMIPFKWRGKYMCFYCGDDVDDYSELRKHTKAHGVCSDRDRAIKLVKSRDSEVKIDVSDMTCEICSESFGYFDEIIAHLQLKHQLPYDKDADTTITTYRLLDLKCVFCEDTFDSFSKLIKHMNHRHPINCFICHDCDRKFNKKRDLESHIRIHHRKEYNCKKCPLNFSSNAALQKHKVRAHISLCNICFQPFPSKSKKVDHIKQAHFDKDRLECGFCQKKLSTKLALLNHAGKCNMQQCRDDMLTYEHPCPLDDGIKKPTLAEIRSNIACIVNMSTALPFKYFMNKFRCFYCPKDFIECDALKEHTVLEHPSCNSKLKCLRLRNREHGIKIKIDISSLSCKMCFEPMQDLDNLINHLITEHKAQYDKSVDNNMQPFKLIRDNFACPFCGEVYRYFSTLLKHISTSHTENRNICSYCGMSFRTDPSLRAHINLRHKPNGHKCNVCDKDFTTRHALRDHLGNAHGNKVAKCQVCSERFTSQYAMQRHMIIVHATGHKCSYCGKMFTKNSFMVNHIRRTHLKEKNVECTVCFERFFDIHLLRMHTVKHVGERNFHCDICGKKFLWKKNLRGHMSSHIKNTNIQIQA